MNGWLVGWMAGNPFTSSNTLWDGVKKSVSKKKRNVLAENENPLQSFLALTIDFLFSSMAVFCFHYLYVCSEQQCSFLIDCCFAFPQRVLKSETFTIVFQRQRKFFFFYFFFLQGNQFEEQIESPVLGLTLQKYSCLLSIIQ